MVDIYILGKKKDIVCIERHEEDLESWKDEDIEMVNVEIRRQRKWLYGYWVGWLVKWLAMWEAWWSKMMLSL